MPPTCIKIYIRILREDSHGISKDVLLILLTDEVGSSTWKG